MFWDDKKQKQKTDGSKKCVVESLGSGFEGSTPHFLLIFLVMLLQTSGEMIPKTTITDTTKRFRLITALSCDHGFKTP